MRDNRAVHAMARILLHGRIDNIQCSWVKLGPAGVAACITEAGTDGEPSASADRIAVGR